MAADDAWLPDDPPKLPYGARNDGLADPTHLRMWMPGSFCALQPGYGDPVGNPQHVWDAPFDVTCVFLRAPRDLLWLLRWPWRQIGARVLRFLWGGFVELIVDLMPLKTPTAVEEFRRTRLGNMIPVAVAAWEHEWNPRYRGPLVLRSFAFDVLGTVKNTQKES